MCLPLCQGYSMPSMDLHMMHSCCYKYIEMHIALQQKMYSSLLRTLCNYQLHRSSTCIVHCNMRIVFSQQDILNLMRCIELMGNNYCIVYHSSIYNTHFYIKCIVYYMGHYIVYIDNHIAYINWQLVCIVRQILHSYQYH